MKVFGFGCAVAVCEKPPVRSDRGIVVAFLGTNRQPQASNHGDVLKFLDDHSLVQECRAGHTEAFGTLVARYQERLYPTILRLLGSAEDAEDILQDAFVRAFQKLDQFQGDSSFYTWIYRIAVNLALSGYRRRCPIPAPPQLERVRRSHPKIPPTNQAKPTRPCRSSVRNARKLSKRPLTN